jgi:hypothetical protein
MTTVNASEFVKAHARWIWEAPENVDERATAIEAVETLFALATGWIDIAALEIRLGFHDRETLTEARTRPNDPFQLLSAQPLLPVRVKPMYEPMESRVPVLDASAAIAWVDAKLTQARIPDERYEPSLRELLIAGSRVRLPDSGSTDTLTVSCYAGEVEVLVDRGWVTAPCDPPGVPNPVSIRIANLDGVLRLVLEVFWSPWADGSEPAAAVRNAISRLGARGWHSDQEHTGLSPPGQKT